MESDEKSDLSEDPVEDKSVANHVIGMKKLQISESGKFAYAAMCSITVGNLFPDKWNINFNKKYVETLCKHLNINEKTKSLMIMFIDDPGEQNPEAYLELLLQEPTLKGKLILIIQDMVLLALKTGKEIIKNSDISKILFISHCTKFYILQISGIKAGEYDARQRVLIRYISDLLNIPFDLVEIYEFSLVEMLHNDSNIQSVEQQKETNQRKKIRNIKRYASIGLATIAGGTLIGLTGGLAAPFIGMGVGTILGGASAVALGSVTGAAIIGSIFGIAGAGLTGYKMNKRVGQIEEFGFEHLNGDCPMQQQLHITIAMTGWLSNDDPDSISKPWKCLNVCKEQYVLRYETKYLIELGQALEYVLSMAVSVATQEALKYTILSGLVSAIAWPATLISIASVIDNPWSVCCRRSSEVGKHLAHVLMSREHGKRPVTLVGFSLGARVIFYCLREMAEIGGAQGIIQDAILLGSPVTNSTDQWNLCSRVVAGKLINGYCSTDWLLKFLYRTLSMATGVAGLMPVKCERITNIDLSSVISGHREYSEKLPEILQFLSVKTKEVQTNIDATLKKSISELPYEDTSSKQTVNSLSTSKSDTCLTSATYHKT